MIRTITENLREFVVTKILARYQTLGGQKLAQNLAEIAYISKFFTQAITEQKHRNMESICFI